MIARLAVVGLGSIGRRHLAALRELECDVVAVRRRPDPGQLASLDEAAAWGAEAIVVATPTSEHAGALEWAVEHGVHAYVEKPLAATTAGVDALLRRAEERGLVVATGYNLRFHPALEAIRLAVHEGRVGRLVSVRAEVGRYLPAWHPDEDYRRSYAARRDLGGGALLTLSHELDYVRWVAGEIASCQGMARKVSSLEIDVDDVAELICLHENGVVSSVHQDAIDRASNRRSRWIGEEGTLDWTWGGPVTVHPDGSTLWHDPGLDVGETYISALRDFLSSVRDGGAPRATGRDGLRVLELCESVLDAG